MSGELESVSLAEGDLVAGRYRIIRVLGEGAMGTVYEAEHGWTRRRVALKVLRPTLANNEKVIARFLREARACAKLSHPSLVEVLDMGQDEHDQLLFLAQELVSGETLRSVLDARGPLPAREAVALVLDIARALAVVHRAGLVHRDVKPENVMVSRDEGGAPLGRLIDFGIARELAPDNASITSTSLGVPIGTPLYMSPEQARASGAIDHRSDLYSLSAVLFECLSGRTPYTGETVTVLLANLLTREPASLRSMAPRAHPALAALVMRGLAREPEARFSSADEMVDALNALDPEALEPCDRAVIDEVSTREQTDEPVPSSAARTQAEDEDEDKDEPSAREAPSAPSTAAAGSSDAQRASSERPPDNERSRVGLAVRIGLALIALIALIASPALFRSMRAANEHTATVESAQRPSSIAPTNTIDAAPAAEDSAVMDGTSGVLDVARAVEPQREARPSSSTAAARPATAARTIAGRINVINVDAGDRRNAERAASTDDAGRRELEAPRSPNEPSANGLRAVVPEAGQVRSWLRPVVPQQRDL